MEQELAGRRVLITGATGFVGQHGLDAFLAAGARVTALLRSRHGAAALRGRGVRVEIGPVGDPGTLDRALAGQDVLCHLAYDLRASAAANLADFDILLAAANRAGLGHMVHASSAVVYDGWPGAHLDETSPLGGPGGGPYRQAKIAMETRLMAGDMPATILQPTLVWGPGSALWTDRLAGALAGGTVVLPDPPGMAALCHVADLAQALVRASALPTPGQARFLISGPGMVPWPDLLEGYAAIIGRGSLRRVPHGDLAARLGPPEEGRDDDSPPLAARVSALARRVLGRDRFEALVARLRPAPAGGDFYPDRHLLDLFSACGGVDIGAARARLGYAPVMDLQAGLAATAPYLRRRFSAG